MHRTGGRRRPGIVRGVPGRKSVECSRNVTTSRRNGFSPVSLWIWLCVLLNAAGWMLSAFHALNKVGYVVVLALSAAVFRRWRSELGIVVPRCQPARTRRSALRRCTRFFPVAFLVIAGLALLGGLRHAPNNYDALAYRVPRVLHWLAAEQWHWIHTDFERLNTRAVGAEWLGAPILMFTHSHRLLFLIGI